MLGKPYAEPSGGGAVVDVCGQTPSHARLVDLFEERLAERILFDNDILCREGDNRTIGLLLCKSKDHIKAEYALRDIQKPIGISDYELGQALPKDFRGSLPTIEEIEKELESDR